MNKTILQSLIGTLSATVIAMTVPSHAVYAKNAGAKPDLISYIQGNTNKTRHISIPRNKAAILKLPRASRDVIVADPCSFGCCGAQSP